MTLTDKQLDAVVAEIMDCFTYDPVLETIVGDGAKPREILRRFVESVVEQK